MKALGFFMVLLALALPVACSDSTGGTGTDGGGEKDAGSTDDGGGVPNAACTVANAGALPGVIHAPPPAGWIVDDVFPFEHAGAHALRLFDPCAGTDTGDPAVCADTIDYTDAAGQTCRLPYRVTAPRDLPAGAPSVPVMLFQHGGGPNAKGQRAYDNLVRFVASLGYVVVQTAVMPACGNNSTCAAIRAAYCQVYGQSAGTDCDQMNIMYFNRPNDFEATLDALPRVFARIDALAAGQSVKLATIADPTRVVLAGHSAGTNGVLSLAGAGFDYVPTAAGTRVDQRDPFPTAFLAIGPNATSSDNGKGWEIDGFQRIPANLPFLFVTGSRDYAVDVPACDRPQSFLAAAAGNKLLQFTDRATHASAALNDEDNQTCDAATAHWAVDPCAPRTSPARGGDDYGPPPGGAKVTTPLELSIYASTEGALEPYLRAMLLGDAAALATLSAAMERAGGINQFDFAATRLERRGPVGGDVKVLGPRAVVIGGACGGRVDLRLLRRGSAAAVTLSASGLPAGVTARFSTDSAPASGDEAWMAIDRGSASAGDFLVDVSGSATGGTVLGTRLRVRLP